MPIADRLKMKNHSACFIQTLRSWLTVWTRTKRTFARSVMLTYVDDLHSLTHVTAAPSVSARCWCCDNTLFNSSINCFCTPPVGTAHRQKCNGFFCFVFLNILLSHIQLYSSWATGAFNKFSVHGVSSATWYHSVTFHPTQVNTPCLNPPKKTQHLKW